MTVHGEDQRSVDALVERGERDGCMRESEIERLAEELGLVPAQLEELRARLAARGIAVDDDCGRPAAPMHYANGDLAHLTVDALGQFQAEATQHRLLTAGEEIELARRIERGDLVAKEQLITHNIRLVVSIAKRYQGTELSLLDLIQQRALARLARVRELEALSEDEPVGDGVGA